MEKELSSRSVGEPLFSPSTKGPSSLRLTFKVAHVPIGDSGDPQDSIMHVEIKEGGKDTSRRETMLSLGKELAIEHPPGAPPAAAFREVYEDLDEAVARFVEPLVANAEHVSRHRKYVAGGKAQVEDLLRLRLRADRSLRGDYALAPHLPTGNASVDGARAGAFYIAACVRDPRGGEPPVHREYFLCHPDGYVFRGGKFPDLEALVDEFKRKPGERGVGVEVCVMGWRDWWMSSSASRVSVRGGGGCVYWDGVGWWAMTCWQGGVGMHVTALASNPTHLTHSPPSSPPLPSSSPHSGQIHRPLRPPFAARRHHRGHLWIRPLPIHGSSHAQRQLRPAAAGEGSGAEWVLSVSLCLLQLSRAPHLPPHATLLPLHLTHSIMHPHYLIPPPTPHLTHPMSPPYPPSPLPPPPQPPPMGMAYSSGAATPGGRPAYPAPPLPYPPAMPGGASGSGVAANRGASMGAPSEPSMTDLLQRSAAHISQQLGSQGGGARGYGGG